VASECLAVKADFLFHNVFLQNDKMLPEGTQNFLKVTALPAGFYTY